MTEVDIVTRLLETFDCGGFTEEERQTALDAAAEIQRLRRQEENDLEAMRLIQVQQKPPGTVAVDSRDFRLTLESILATCARIRLGEVKGDNALGDIEMLACDALVSAGFRVKPNE